MLIDELKYGKTNFNKEDIFMMDTLFKNFEILKGIKKVNGYANLENMVNDYKNKLDNIFIKSDGHLGDRILEAIGENPYQRTIDLSFGEYYNLIWNVDKLKKIINENKIKKRPFLLTGLIDVVDENGINKFALENASKNKKPIIVGYFPQLNPHYIVIDGNHRVMSRYQRHKKIIMGYEISPQYLAKGLAGEIFKNLFIMHLNMHAVLTYIVGEINEKQLNAKIIPVINNMY
ncbi:hypothetical protein LGL55_05780 [Clostridium tagluense]|uniref:hypothetical protein n=1 Tax=Clostridium tagluense TaxID=360422 RepID=UPI001CF11478|nr:hypothetical protein [Clostridium tagluense]MCB2310631.1 hypothetical protein [Clostridium tagluense]MCB2315638.1 hypothetical protein [Clostridium tagluense]MCB2320492.1 hypothetical protein [Clostridium tagluense]MCB2325225.1 hypothetical protein [Clostridium tagluense]MCB2330077.1 hypothetical protein [Clostridium tagluense]